VKSQTWMQHLWQQYPELGSSKCRKNRLATLHISRDSSSMHSKNSTISLPKLLNWQSLYSSNTNQQ
jgi:hypothetical protein